MDITGPVTGIYCLLAVTIAYFLPPYPNSDRGDRWTGRGYYYFGFDRRPYGEISNSEKNHLPVFDYFPNDPFYYLSSAFNTLVWIWILTQDNYHFTNLFFPDNGQSL